MSRSIPTKDQADQIDYAKPMTPAIPDDLVSRVTAVAGDRAGEVDWDAVQRAGLAATGLPTPGDRRLRRRCLGSRGQPLGLPIGVLPVYPPGSHVTDAWTRTMLKLYDLAGADPDRRFSPYCWRIKMALGP